MTEFDCIVNPEGRFIPRLYCNPLGVMIEIDGSRSYEEEHQALAVARNKRDDAIKIPQKVG